MGLIQKIGEWNKKRVKQAEERRAEEERLRQERTAEEERLRQERTNQLSDFENGKLPQISVTNSTIIFKKNEIVHKVEKLKLYEPRSIRNYGGGSIRITKGLRVYTGQAESHLEKRQIDSGALILTNQRLIFIGGLRTTTINLKKIFNIIPFTNGFQINREGKQKPESFSSEDPESWIASINGAIKNYNRKRK